MPKVIEVEREWSTDQLAAIDEIVRWRDEDRNQFLTFGGFAGTGKTTIVAELATLWKDSAVCALCGKAASVLRSKGIKRASTIHSLVYEPDVDEDGNLIGFTRKQDLDCDSIIVDEASMVNEQLHNYLLSFGLPVLYVGDHGQLEPIQVGSREPFNLMHDPEVRLEVIHRQAAGNSIIDVSAAFREGRHGDVLALRGSVSHDGRVRVVPLIEVQDNLSGTVICGTNRTRHRINSVMRQRLGHGDEVEAGDMVICLQNNRKLGVFNGQLFTVVAVHQRSSYSTKLTMTDDSGNLLTVRCRTEQFGRDKMEYQSGETLLLDYGYCLTAHKAQGSEFDDVTVIDEVMGSWDACRWRYTSATRAKERLVYCI